MRAILLSEQENYSLIKGQKVAIEGERAKHLIKVARAKVDEPLLLMDGKGGKFFSRIVEISRNSLTAMIYEEERPIDKRIFELGICLVKKDAMEEIVKLSVELGIKRILPLQSQYSQPEIKGKKERYEKLIESAAIQSNNPFGIVIEEPQDLRDLDLASFDKIFYFSSKGDFFPHPKMEKKVWQKPLILIGPEGGLSEAEEDYLVQKKNVEIIHLSTFILRAPHAVCTALGYLLGKLS